MMMVDGGDHEINDILRCETGKVDFETFYLERGIVRRAACIYELRTGSFNCGRNYSQNYALLRRI